MKVVHLLGHNSNWSIDSHFDQNIGESFIITAFTHGIDFDSKPLLKKIKDNSMIDLQFYGKKESRNIAKGKLSEFSFHPANCNANDVTNVYFESCIKQAIKFQKDRGFKNIIIPHYYENEEVVDIINTIVTSNNYIEKVREEGEKYYMTLPFANHIIIDKHKVEEILNACTDMEVCFDGYFIVCENKPEAHRKVTTDLKLLKNLSRVFKTLKSQEFSTIYAYANWDALLFLAQTDIDYITIGNYENLRNFDIKRYTQNESGGASKGYYFSEKLLNMVRADDITILRDTNNLSLIQNEKNIFSDVILKYGYQWNIHKPDVNKNYFLSINRLLHDIASISDINERKKSVLELVENAINNYDSLSNSRVYLNNEGSNYHLNVWKTLLSNS